MGFQDNSTKVSKASPGIKKILAATVGTWGGKKVEVEQAHPSWFYQLYNDTGEPHVYTASATGGHAQRIERPSYGGPAVRIDLPEKSRGNVVVIKQIGSTGAITIVVPMLDAHKLDVARDALLTGDRKAFAEIFREFGLYSGIAQAVVESQARTLKRAEKPDLYSDRYHKRDLDAFVRRYKG